jgi:PST family polysaccharide transporter
MSRAHRVTRNFAILSFARIFNQVLAVTATLYLTRVLLPEAFGVMVFALGVLGWINLIADFGLTSLGQREVARHEFPLHRMVRVVIAIQIVLSLVAFGVLAAFTYFASISPAAKQLILLYGLSLPISAWDLRWVYYGLEKMSHVGIAETVSQAILTGGALLLVQSSSQLAVLPVLFILAQAASAAYLLKQYSAEHGFPAPVIDRSLMRHLLVDALPLCGSGTIGMVLNNFSTLIIGLVMGLQEAGHFGAAQRIVWVPTLFIAAYYLTLRPSLARAHVDGLHTINSLLRRSVRLTIAMAMGMMVGGVLLGRPFILFLFGQEYEESVTPFQVLVCATALIFVNRLFRGILISFNQQVAEFKMMLTAASINVTVAILLIAPLGLTGVAISTLVGEAAMMGLGFVYTKSLVGKVPFGRFLWKPFVCSVVMAIVLLAMDGIHVAIRIGVGGFVYIVLLILMDVIHRDDIRTVLRAILPGSRTRPEQEELAP